MAVLLATFNTVVTLDNNVKARYGIDIVSPISSS